MSIQTVLPIDRNSVAELSRNAGEPEWMANLRLKGLELAESLELPKLEKTRIDRWNLGTYGSYKKEAVIGSASDLPAVAAELLKDGLSDNLLVQRNSTVVFHQLDGRLASQGVIFMDLETALQKHADLIERYFMKAVSQDENRLTALHSALWNGGAFLYVPKNVRIEKPLQALFLSDDDDAVLAPHILVVAEANSSVSYVENVISSGSGQQIINTVSEVFAASGAHVQFASIHNLGEKITDIAYRRAIVENDAHIEWIVGELNDGNSVSDTTSILKGNGSSSDHKVISIGSGAQRLNLTTRAIHIGKASNSNMITRAVMKDEATAIINGVTVIKKGATGTNGEQTERILMLSPKARGDANPILLIDEDDVKAGHAASAGQVNWEYIYYLMSRGISENEAKRLITYGFLAPIVSEIPSKELEEQLQQLVERKLGQ